MKENSIIKPRSYINAKQELLKYAKQIPTHSGLPEVDSSGGLFGMFDHHVTGDELNELTSQLQDYFKSYNALHIENSKAFIEVYNALESLDKEYINGIQIAAEDAKKASNQALKSIENQKKIVEVLSKHKQRLDSYQHLDDIDSMWKDVKDIGKEIARVRETNNKIAEEMSIIKQKAIRAYIVSGISLTIGLCGIILVLMRVL